MSDLKAAFSNICSFFMWKHDCALTIVSSASCPQTAFITHPPVMRTVYFFISSLSSLRLAHHPCFSCHNRGRRRQAAIKSTFALSFIYRSLPFALLPSKASSSSLCVALVITSCLKQTDGIRESDGQFSQRMFCLCMRTELLSACALSMHTLLPSSSFTLHPASPSLSVSLHLYMVGVCLCECVRRIRWGITWQNVLVHDGSRTVSSHAVALAILDARCHSGPLWGLRRDGCCPLRFYPSMPLT